MGYARKRRCRVRIKKKAGMSGRLSKVRPDEKARVRLKKECRECLKGRIE